ncbi:META domain-containing protein [Corynebacterium qintianiae]|uniref:META domain-containing protein n=1 Tax=Corynebacterium qintianiae TaxID=2709392 RepID=UPI0013EB6451|nr:META domain-containing protein [Corynebacterium qintianiae]
MNSNRKLSLALGAGVAIFLGTCSPVSNASASSSSTSIFGGLMNSQSPTPAIVPLPADAVPATGGVLARVMDTEWVPQPAHGKTRVSFAPQHGTEGFRVEGGPCNGYGTVIHPDADSGRYTTTPLPVTRMACDSFEYEGAITQALHDANTFYVAGDDTLYLAGNNGALKLVRAD